VRGSTAETHLRNRRPAQGRVAHRGQNGALDHAIGQQLMGDPLDLAGIQRALDQKAMTGGDDEVVSHAQFGRGCGDLPAHEVRLSFGCVNVNFPKHHGSSSRW
jgi:hypothetical protein